MSASSENSYSDFVPTRDPNIKIPFDVEYKLITHYTDFWCCKNLLNALYWRESYRIHLIILFDRMTTNVSLWSWIGIMHSYTTGWFCVINLHKHVSVFDTGNCYIANNARANYYIVSEGYIRNKAGKKDEEWCSCINCPSSIWLCLLLMCLRGLRRIVTVSNNILTNIF